MFFEAGNAAVGGGEVGAGSLQLGVVVLGIDGEALGENVVEMDGIV